MDIATLNEHFVVDPSSPSGLRNKRKRGARALAGQVAGSLKNGYWIIRVDGRFIAAHRVVWAMSNQTPVPDGLLVDHRDRTKSNRPDNLRLASHVENAYNSTRRPGKTGFVGVSYHEKDRKYRAQVCFKTGRPTQVAYCTTPEEAAACRDYVLAAVMPEHYVPSGSTFELSASRKAKLDRLLQEKLRPL